MESSRVVVSPDSASTFHLLLILLINLRTGKCNRRGCCARLAHDDDDDDDDDDDETPVHSPNNHQGGRVMALGRAREATK
eukprot:scaffold149652_cov45-Attheya_sp.AAC.2